MMPDYVFFREEGFYPIYLESPESFITDDEYAIMNAKVNPGTLKIEDRGGNIIWEAEDH